MFILERSCYNNLKFTKKNHFSVLQSYGYLNILCHIFSSARTNQPTGNFHSRHGFCGRRFRWEGFAIWLHFLTGRRACTHGKAGSRLDSYLLPTAVNSLVKMNGLRTRLTSTLSTTMSGELCLNPSREHRWSQESSVVDNGTSCHKTRATKPHWAFRKDFRFVWKMVMDTSNIH